MGFHSMQIHENGVMVSWKRLLLRLHTVVLVHSVWTTELKSQSSNV